MPIGGKAGEGYVDIKPRLDPRFGSNLARQVQPALQSLGSRLSTAGRGLQNFGRQVSTFVGLPLAALGTAAFRASRDFGQAMANVDSIMKLSNRELRTFSSRILDLSERLPQDATTLADGLYQIASSGFTGTKAMRVLTESAKAASAGLTTTEVAADAITSALLAYGLKAKDAGAISDTLFKGVDKGKITFEELASSLGDYVGMASQLKIPLEDVVAAQASMTLTGQSAFEAATSLNNMLRSMLKPSEGMKDALEDMGFESGQAALESIGLDGVIEKLSARVGDNKEEWLKLFPEIRAARGAMALASNDGKTFTRVQGEMADKVGATGAALKEQAKGPAFQWQRAMNRLRRPLIELGNTLIPILTDDIIPAVQQVADWFSRLPDSTKGWVVKFGLAAVALGPLASVLGTVVKSLGWILRYGSKIVFPVPPVGVPGTGGTVPVPGRRGAPRGGAPRGPGGPRVPGLPIPALVPALAYALGSISETSPAQGAATQAVVAIKELTAALARGKITVKEYQGAVKQLRDAHGSEYYQSRLNLEAQNGLNRAHTQAVGKLNRLQARLKDVGGELSHQQRDLVEGKIRVKDYGGAFKIVEGAIRRAIVGPLKNIGRSHDVAGARAEIQAARVRALGVDLQQLKPPKPIRVTADTSPARASLAAFEASVQATQARLRLGPTGFPSADVDAQHGFSGTVNRPTLFLAGERGVEDVFVIPRGKEAKAKLGVRGAPRDGGDERRPAVVGADLSDLVGLEVSGTLTTAWGPAELRATVIDIVTATGQADKNYARMNRAGGE